MFTEDGRMDREIETRIQKTNAITFIHDSTTQTPQHLNEHQKKLINSIFIPTLCYQCQTWTLNKSQEMKIQTCEMRCLRKAVNITRRDRVRNTDIRNIIGITPITEHIEHQRINWFGHLVRMHYDKPASQAYNKWCSGYKARGRPRKRWIECVAETCLKYGLTTRVARLLAYDRKLHLPTMLKGRSGQKKERKKVKHILIYMLCRTLNVKL